MSKINVMVNGLPGNVAAIIASHIADDSRFTLVPFSLTGPEIQDEQCNIKDIAVKLIKPDTREDIIAQIQKDFPSLICIDYTHPSAVNSNVKFYVKSNQPFIMGTTGGDRQKLEKTILEGKICAIIAPNMAKQIVGFQAMMDYAANTFPDLFKGYSLEIKESHQNGKADTSGTAKAMVKYYNKLGIPFSEDQILQERDPQVQKNENFQRLSWR